MVQAAIESEIGSLLAQLKELGFRVSTSQYDAERFGNFRVESTGPSGAMRLTRDRLRYMVSGDEVL